VTENWGRSPDRGHPRNGFRDVVGFWLVLLFVLKQPGKCTTSYRANYVPESPEVAFMAGNQRIRRSALASLGVLVTVLSGLGGSGCDDSPSGPFWCAIDTLYCSGIVITDTSSVRRAFEGYVAYVDSTDASFRGGATRWEFASTAYDGKYQGIRYWKIWHREYFPERPAPLLRRTVDVDENGTVVYGLGCM